ncbi:M14 family metallopeptidase [Sediminicola luteus]|uniref:Peptidase M14 domain-containing protein n=1 Tax=Sediminicola luteus TaxID=319238 RepID=A0A2A4G6B2_9FLAO|nr:M14 metallopeptidase family protein [Sediminicola luteus]PCE63973.1 hypothetical protein B7P33_12015 [Sediminicola luteus]
MMEYTPYALDITLDRYFPLEYLEIALNRLKIDVSTHIIGYSEQQRPIYGLEFGEGPTKVLMWSQMHGNESTTTKALIDLLHLLQYDAEVKNIIVSNCKLYIIPILSPDGAKKYTRLNANQVDLNRDSQKRTQVESQLLRKVFESFQPDFCFNLHGQRTIFSVGQSAVPATVSFLAPAFDEARSLNEHRKTAMQLIALMTEELYRFIPKGVGRYDDGFNANCVGDAFMMAGVPTILFEAGHFPNDYNRTKTRELIFRALLAGLRAIIDKSFLNYSVTDYLAIPENGKCFVDIIVSNAHELNKNIPKNVDLAILFKEELVNEAVDFVPQIMKKGDVTGFYGHKQLNAAENADRLEISRFKRLSRLIEQYGID